MLDLYLYCKPRITWNTTFFFFNDTATTEIYTLSLHDALPIYPIRPGCCPPSSSSVPASLGESPASGIRYRSEEHTSELQSHLNLVCRLLLEKKNQSYGLKSECTAYTFCTVHTSTLARVLHPTA